MLTFASRRFPQRSFYGSVGLLMMLGLLLRLIGLNKGMWFDEYVSVQIATASQFGKLLKVYDYPPSYFFLLKIWGALGQQEPFLRLLSVLLGIATLIGLAFWLKFYSRLASLLTLLFWVTSPTALRYSHEIQTYPLLLFATATSFLFAARFAQAPRNRVNIVGLGLILALLVTTHLVGIMLLPCVALYIVLLTKKDHWPQLILPTLVAFAVPSLCFAVMYFVFLGGATKSSWWMPPPSWALVSAIFKAVSGWSSLFGLLHLFQQGSIPSAWLYDIVIKVAAGFSLVGLLILGNWRKGFPLLLAAVLYWGELLGYSILKTPVFWDRTVTPGLVPLFAFFAVQIATIRLIPLRTLICAAVIFLNVCLAGNWVVNQATKPYERWRELTTVLQQEWQATDLIVAFPRHATLPIAYHMSHVPESALIGITQLEQLNAAEPVIRSNRSNSLFLVIRHDFTSINNQAVYAKLDALLHSLYGSPLSQQDFDVVTLIHYTASKSANASCTGQPCLGQQP